VPDLVVEILSASTARRDRTEKREIYAKNGVREYSIVDEVRRTVTVCHGERGMLEVETTYSRGRVESRVLPRLELDVDEIFADLA
jgi:Uma2 family endonuclease